MPGKIHETFVSVQRELQLGLEKPDRPGPKSWCTFVISKNPALWCSVLHGAAEERQVKFQHVLESVGLDLAQLER